MKKLLPFLLCCLLFSMPFSSSFAQVTQRNVAVSAVIPPTASSYEFTFDTDGQTTVAQRAILNYTITYGVQDGMDLDAPLTIVAHFNDDLAPDASHVTTYVLGSASNAYGGATPVVDLTNRTITWTIAHLPEGTRDQTVTFQLKTTENYSGTTPVTFTTKATMSNQYVTMPELSATQTYTFNPAFITPTPAPQSGPTATPRPGPTATPVPAATTTLTPTIAPKQTPLQLTDVSFPNISQSTTSITILTNEPVTVETRYGTSQTNLNQVVSTTKLSTRNVIILKNLKPNTTYYFQTTVMDAQGYTRQSELFSFKTATASTEPTLDQSIFILGNTSGVMISNVYDQTGQASALGIMAQGTALEVRLKLANPIAVTTMVAIISPKVLGINTYTKNIPSQAQITVPLQEIEPGVYSAHMHAPRTVGNYYLSIQVTDKSGNVVQNKMADLRVLPLLTVLDKQTHKPIAGARVVLSFYNPGLHKYQVMPESFAPGLHNPSFSNTEGAFNLQLPLGRYEATVSAFGHKAVTVPFILGSKDSQDYPIVYLQSDPFNITSLLTFSRDWFADNTKMLLSTGTTLIFSPQLFTSIALAVTTGFVVLTFLLFSIRTQITFSHLLPFFLYALAVKSKRHKEDYLSGRIRDRNANPIGMARIDIIDPKALTILGHTQTTAAGTFHIRNDFTTAEILLLITKDGYAPEEISVQTTRKEQLSMVLQQRGETKPIMQSLRHVAGSLFEVSLLFSFVLELIFFATFGAVSTLPFLAFSLLNIVLWLFYLEEHTRL